MKHILAGSLLLLTLHTSPLSAQNYFYNNRYYENNVVVDLGLSGGIMNALTDLGGKKGPGKNFLKDLRWATMRPSFGFYAAAMIKDVLGVRLEGTFGKVTGYDSILRNVASTTFGRYERNLSFVSPVNEIQLALEFHPIYLFRFNDNAPRLSPYGVVGAGRYSFDPQAELDGQWYRLQPLSLEGQGFREYRGRDPYKLTQFNVVLGMGLRYEISSLFNARLELAHRVLFTDYLDDVSRDYIDPNLFANYLPANLARVAERLYSRKGELNPSDQTFVGEGRGDFRDNDAFFTIQLKLGVTLGRRQR